MNLMESVRIIRSPHTTVVSRLRGVNRLTFMLERKKMTRGVLAFFRSRRALLAGGVLYWSLACATPAPDRGRPPAGTSAGLVLEVTNRGWSDVVVYLADGAVPSRLGRVPALKHARLVLHRGQGPVRVLVRAWGSKTSYVPEPVWASPGQVLELTVQPVLRTSELVAR
jgi:hypothetical protein